MSSIYKSNNIKIKTGKTLEKTLEIEEINNNKKTSQMAVKLGQLHRISIRIRYFK